MQKRTPLFWLFLLSFVLHAAVVFFLGHYENPTTWENGMIADQIFQGAGFAGGFSLGSKEQTSWQAPFYPYLLATAWKWLGRTAETHLLISLLQALLVASMVFPMKALTTRWFGITAGWIALGLTIFMPLYLWYPTRLHHTAWVMGLYPWLLWGWVTLRSGSPWPIWLLTGLATGLAGLIQPVMVAFFGLLSGCFLLGALMKLHKDSLRPVLGILVAGLATLVVLTPWTLRNYEVHGRWMLVKNSFGKEFWMGNNPHATGTGLALGGKVEITNQFPPKASALKGHVTEMELMDAYKDEGMQWVRENPEAFVKITLQKMGWLWTMTPADRVRSLGGGEALVFRTVHAAYWFAFLAVIGVGFLCGKRWPGEYTFILGVAVVLVSLIYGLTHVGQARFRGEIEFLFIPPVAAAVVAIMQRWQKKNRFLIKETDKEITELRKRGVGV